MNSYRSPGFRNVLAENMNIAAEIFANRAARKRYGRRGYSRTCTIQSWSQDNTLGEYQAFIGYRTAPQETTGSNVHFTVYLNKPAAT